VLDDDCVPLIGPCWFPVNAAENEPWLVDERVWFVPRLAFVVVVVERGFDEYTDD